MSNRTLTSFCIVSLILSFLASGCSSHENGKVSIRLTTSGKIRTVVDNSWNPGTKAIINKSYTGAWEFRELAKGDSIVIRLHRSDFLIGTFDGHSSHEIVFQLPSEIQLGKIYQLKPAAPNRPTRKVGQYHRLAEMQEGELTAFKFGNPTMGRMKQVEKASVQIISIADNEAVIKLELKANLDPDWDFDISKKFTVALKKPRAPQKSAR